jgi:hypothetical protein
MFPLGLLSKCGEGRSFGTTVGSVVEIGFDRSFIKFRMRSGVFDRFLLGSGVLDRFF